MTTLSSERFCHFSLSSASIIFTSNRAHAIHIFLGFLFHQWNYYVSFQVFKLHVCMWKRIKGKQVVRFLKLVKLPNRLLVLLTYKDILVFLGTIQPQREMSESSM